MSNRTTVAASPAPLGGAEATSEDRRGCVPDEGGNQRSSVRGPTRLCPVQRPIPDCSGANAIAMCCMYRPGPLHLSSSLALHGILFGHRRPCRVMKVRDIESVRCAQLSHMRSHLHVVWKVRECGSKQVPKEGSNRGPRQTWVKKHPLIRKESLCAVHSNGPFPCRRAAARPSLSRPHTDVDPSQK